MAIEHIGCCGAYCLSCPALADQSCHGCKLGYENGSRQITDAKCAVKRCCLAKKHRSCADCIDYETCEILHNFYAKMGFKYRKYRLSTQYIRQNGYQRFVVAASVWKNAFGKLH